MPPAPDTTRFDGAAFLAAIERRRAERELTWAALAAETGVSAATIKRIASAAEIEADGALALARWVGRSLESFSKTNRRLARERMAGPKGRFDCRSLHAALDAERNRRGLTWRALAAELGLPGASSLTRLAKGGRIGVRLMLTLTAWLGARSEDFARNRG